MSSSKHVMDISILKWNKRVSKVLLKPTGREKNRVYVHAIYALYNTHTEIYKET